MKVLVVDDHPLYREGVRAVLCSLNAETQVAGAASLDMALLLLKVEGPFDLVLLDMHLPGVNGLGGLAAIKDSIDDVPVVILSADEDPGVMLKAVEAGAAGYIPKSTDQQITLNALRLVMAHGVYLPPAALNAAASAATVDALGCGDDPPALSQRQQDVLRRLLQGKSNKVIARELCIAEGTVKAHLWSTYQVLGVANRLQAMRRAHELGLVGRLTG